ncbi:hypothetical protein HY604_04110 [Candidatus Peregrinibacteria bacterium]|nr:hypothetical protein [Candidatus Peregrinibacteria bacterium]
MNIISSANVYFLTAMTIVLFSITACTRENAPSQNNNIPAYEILDTVDLINGDKFAEVLITSFSKETSQQELETTAKKIAEEINVDEVDIYCSREAQKANYSESFSKEHPNAIDECYLGNYK